MIGTSRSVWGFDPRSVPGCQLWLDAADSNTVTLSGSNVTQWRDKSGNGNNATPYSGTVTYSSVSNAVSFSEAGLQTPIVTPTNRVGSGFFVVKVTSSPSFSVFQGSGVSPGGRQFRNDNGTTLRTVKEDRADMFFSGSTVINTLMIAGYIDDGTNLTHSVNGTLYSTTTAITFTSGTTVLIGVSRNAEYLVGNIYEVVLFNTALTTSERQQIEGYLAHKWGLSLSIPSTHPFSSIRPHLRTFQPIDVPGCQLWLDGADQSSMTLSGSSVTQWNDKSGNGYNMNTIAGSSSTYWSGTPAYPTIGTSINGLQTVNFKAQSGLKQATTLDGVKNLFWVGRIAAPDGSGSAPNYFLLGHDSVYDWSANSYGDKFLYAPIVPSGINNASASLFTSDPNAVTNTAFQNVYLPSAPNVSLLSVSGITGTTRYQGICYDRDIHIGWCGDLAEVLIFSTALTTSQRQQVEGYLAHKWGLSLSLPVISPLSIPGCQLWLDAADSSSMTLSGSSVTQWRDKSLNVSSTTSVAGSNVLTQNAMNGRPAILLNGSSSFTGSTTGSGTTLTVCIVATQASGCASDGGLVCFGRTGFSDWNDVGSLAITKWASNSGQMVSTRVTNSQTVNTGLSTPFIYILVFDGTFVNSYLNGTIQTPSNISRTGTFAYTKYTIGTRADTGTASWTGFIGESIVYNSALTTSQRQQIEGYLARKWGISISATLPSTHPFKSFPPATLPFSPRNISGLALWLDAADATTVVQSSGSISQWNDKSTSALTATAVNNPTIVANVQNGLPGVSFNGSTQYFNLGNNLNMLTNQLYIFAVSKFNSTADGTIIGKSTYSGGVGRYSLLRLGGTLTLLIQGNGDKSDSGVSSDTNTSTRLLNTVWDRNTVVIYQNGSSVFSAGLSEPSSVTNSYSLLIGAYQNDSGGTPPTGGLYMNGFIHEILLYFTPTSSPLTTSQRQQVEGYLAQKWGLTTSLPATHPYVKLPA